MEEKRKKKPHYSWWPYIREIIMEYPSRRSVELRGVAQREQEAVQAAINATERMVNGEARLKAIRLVLWDRKTLDGAALVIPCSRRTVARWQRRFFEEVARGRDLLD